MPISPGNRRRYPPDWPEISLRRRIEAHWRCEWCPAQQDRPHPVTGSIVVLTVAHLDHQPENSAPGNLAALCQRCHLIHDGPHHRQSFLARRRAEMRTAELFEDAEA